VQWASDSLNKELFIIHLINKFIIHLINKFSNSISFSCRRLLKMDGIAVDVCKTGMMENGQLQKVDNNCLLVTKMQHIFDGMAEAKNFSRIGGRVIRIQHVIKNSLRIH
jgi:hypothetical protein